MPLPERTIESAIEQLKKSPGTFQRLVESYAYLTYPHQFKEIIPQGRDSGDVPIKGWPDIYALSTGFMLDVVEVTHSPSWARHLEEDLEKAEALGSGQLSGFLFVAWANEPSPLIANKQKNPQHEQLVSYRQRLLALGIPPENINFVFKKQLVRALSQPRFANVVTGILALPSHCAPFRTISGNREIFGTSGAYDVFAPSKEEYENDLVHRAAITDEVEKRLNSQGWAWLRGRGAAGKTVLAIHLGLAYESRSLPAYYLDLSKTDVSVSDALDIITTHADDGVLFILDNVHLNQAFARDCFDHWQSVTFGSRLLLIGRDTTTFDFRGTALPLDDLKAEAQTLEVTQADLEGVFLRLARRAAPNSSDPIPNPPQDALQRWLRLFGGDLIAFSAAVAHRLKQMGQYDWTIQAQDATTYVQLAYLGKANDAERINLLRLAVLAQLELDVPEETLELTKVEAFLQNGLVHSVGRGRDNRYGYCRLVHPGLGDLLLTAAGYTDEELKQFISEQYGYIAYRNPFAGAHIAARLESGGRLEEAALILKGIVELESGLVEILAVNRIAFFRINTERLIRLGVLSYAEIEDRLAAVSSTLGESALKASLHFLASFLEYLERKFPRLYTLVLGVLEQPENVRRLSNRALQTSLHILAVFLDYAERKPLKLYTAIVTVLEQPESAKRLSERALQTPLGDLGSFLEYTERKLPKLSTLVVAVLEQPESAKQLSESALQTPLHILASFLEYAQKKLPRLHISVVAVLEQPESAKRLSESALQTPLGDLGSFLEYAERKLPWLYIAIATVLEQPESAKRLSESALQTPLNHLASFLEYAERKLLKLYPAVVTVLEQPESAKRFSESALQTPLSHLAFFLEYVKKKLPKLYTAVVTVLEQPETAKKLSESALQAPLSDVAFFLQYAKKKLPRLYTAVVTVFEQPESAKRLSESALQTPLSDLAVFLEFTKGKLPITSEAITNKLAEPENINFIAEKACYTPLDSLLHFMQTAMSGSAVVQAIDKNKWDKRRLEYMSEQLDSFPVVAKTFQSLGRPELGEAPAIVLITVADHRQWNSNTVGLHHLSHVMRLGRAAGEDVIHNFITSIATPSWLKEKYENAPTYGIASALFGMWGYYEDAVLSHFNIGALKSRVRYELNYLGKMPPEPLLAALELLGVSALIGVRVGVINTGWPRVDSVNEAVRLAIPTSEATTISHITIQLWLGLRVMAGIRADQVYIQPDLGNRVLAIWKNSVGYTEKQNTLNKSMISWMERCAKAGWMLIADRQKA